MFDILNIHSLLLTCSFPIFKILTFKKRTIMSSGEDLERFYFQYQTEAVPHGVSLQSFCSTNNVPYNLFHKWYKDTRRKIVEV